MHPLLVDDGEADFETVVVVQLIPVAMMDHLLDLGKQIDAPNVVKDHFKYQTTTVSWVLSQIQSKSPMVLS